MCVREREREMHTEVSCCLDRDEDHHPYRPYAITLKRGFVIIAITNAQAATPRHLARATVHGHSRCECEGHNPTPSLATSFT